MTDAQVTEMMAELRAIRALLQADAYLMHAVLGVEPNNLIVWPKLELLPAFDAATPQERPGAAMSPGASHEIPSSGLQATAGSGDEGC